jgi:hypothetical protein
MDWLRYQLGVAGKPPAPVRSSAPSSQALQARQQQQTADPAARRAKLLKQQQIEIRAIEADIALANKDIQEATAHRDWATVKRGIEQRKKLEVELARLRPKHENVAQTDAAIQRALANHDQTQLLHDGSKELDEITQATESLNVEEAVDRMQAAADRLEDHDTILSEPIFSSVTADEYVVDEELEALKRQAEEEDALRMPSLPERKPAAAARVATAENEKTAN